jgi:SAM-dependent methyltransferase
MYGPDLAHIHHTGFSEFVESASPFILETLWRHGIRDGLVIDVGCGSGILARELTRSGFAVLGIDASDAMIALAHSGADQQFCVEPGDLARLETAEGGRLYTMVARFEEAELPPCRAITAIGEVLSYGDIATFIDKAARAIEPGGVLLFDVVEEAIDEERRIEGDDWSVIIVKTGTTRRILTFRMDDGTMRRDEETHTIHIQDRDKVRALLDPHFTFRTRRSYGSRRLPRGNAVYICKRR